MKTQNTEILIDALKQIASYGNDGICPYGCDTPYIAIKALVDFGNKEYFDSYENMQLYFKVDKQ